MGILGIGTDIVDIGRISILHTKYQGFKYKILTQQEISAARSITAEYIAGRWCAKEAIAKAIGTGFSNNCRILDISILNQPDGKPNVAINGVTKAYLDKVFNKYVIHLSISHDKYAVAFCIIEIVTCN